MLGVDELEGVVVLVAVVELAGVVVLVELVLFAVVVLVEFVVVVCTTIPASTIQERLAVRVNPVMQDWHMPA
jgi:predicted small integral membrane protein